MGGPEHELKLTSTYANSVRTTDFFQIQSYLRYIFVILDLFCDPDCVLGLLNIEIYNCPIFSNHDIYSCLDALSISNRLSLSLHNFFS